MKYLKALFTFLVSLFATKNAISKQTKQVQTVEIQNKAFNISGIPPKIFGQNYRPSYKTKRHEKVNRNRK